MVTSVAVQRAFQRKTKAAGDGGAALVFGVALDEDTPRAQHVKGEVGNHGYGFGNIALARILSTHPIANLKARHIPVYAVQTAAAHQCTGPRFLQKEQ